jgi:Arm DNA-binding domain
LSLTAIQITKTKPDSKLKKLSDGQGLQLHIFPNGSKLWRLAYRFDGRQKLLSLGAFPEVGLQGAREAKDAAKKLLASGIDPSQQKRLDRAELVVKKRKEGRSQSTITKIEWLLGLTSEIGTRPIMEIKPVEILNVLRGIEEKGNYETATRLKSTISEVFRLAVATGRADSDPHVACGGLVGDVALGRLNVGSEHWAGDAWYLGVAMAAKAGLVVLAQEHAKARARPSHTQSDT